MQLRRRWSILSLDEYLLQTKVTITFEKTTILFV